MPRRTPAHLGALMHLLVAIDGSAGSHDAARLIATSAWPTGTSVTLLSVVDPGGWIPPGAGVPDNVGLTHEADIAAYYQGQQLAARTELEQAGLTIESIIVEGRPASTILGEAKRVATDLVVVGSRGHGRIAALLLGSVSAGVVDRATCSVLVARSRRVTNVLLAVDGSRTARSAARIAATWPAFDGLPITVLSVSEPVRPWSSGISPAFIPRARRRFQHLARNAESEAREIAEEAVTGLQAAGRQATADVRNGDVSSEVIAGAEEHKADLVVIGCRGRTRLRTLLLGSVARDVVLASSASVLTVRGTVRPIPVSR